MNLKRLLTTVIGLPIVILVLVLGNKYIIDFIIAIIAIIAMNEYIKCVSHKTKVISWISYLSVATIALIHIIPSEILSKFYVFAIPVILLILFFHIIISNMKITFENVVYTLMGIAYILGFCIFIPLTYGIEGNVSGKILVWYIVFSAWATDIVAYLIGKRFGKTKFSKVSPNKSVEGCIAGIIGAVVANLVFTIAMNKCFDLELSYMIVAIVSVVLSIIGQIGDFSASCIKRYFDVKDFSELFPGHGGMIDRIDSVIFIAPFAYLLFTMFL